MQFKLTNINKIKDATININGLTVIAGINDSGKSTVGKVLFSLIKAIGNVGNQNDEQQYRRIRMQATNLYLLLNSIERTQQIDLKEKLTFPTKVSEFIEELMNATIADKFLLEDKEKLTETLDITPQQKARIIRYLEKLKEEVFKSKEPQDILKKEIETVIEGSVIQTLSSFYEAVI